MFKITKFIDFIKYVSGFILVELGIFAVNDLGVAKMILGPDFATNYFYPFLKNALQWATVVIEIALFCLVVYSIISYIRNHGKPKEPSDELKAISELLTEIKGLRQDIKDQGGCKYIEPIKNKRR